MVGIPMNYEAYARKLGLPMIISADKKHPAGLFSPEIFGVTEDDRNTKSALINLNCNVIRPIVLDMMKRVNRTIVKCATTKMECYIRKGRIYEVKSDYNEEPGDVRGYGPTFLYINWNSLDKKQFEQQTGRFSNIQVKRTIGMLSRENVFQHYIYVIPIGFREEEQDTIMIVNDINVLYGDIIRYSRILAQPVQGVNNTDIEVILQAKVLEFGEYIQGRFLGPHGVARKKIMSKPIDNSARMVILPNYYKDKKLGKSDIGIGAIGIPLHHLISIFRDSIIKFSLDFITALHSQGYFPEGTTSDMLPFYDVEYLTERIAKMEDIYQRTVPFPAIKPDGTFGTIVLPFEIEANGIWNTVNKELTWAEFFYIVAVGYLDVYHTRYTTATRYPIDSILSQQFLKPKPITISPTLTKHVKVFGFDFSDFPLIDDHIKSNFQEKVWEQAARMNSAVTESMSGDHDGDSISIKGINSREAVEECNKINDNLLEIFDYAGNFRRGVGKDPVQTVWSFTRDPKPSEKPKRIPDNHPFIQYLNKVQNGNLDIDVLYSYTLSFDSNKKPEINLYDRCTIRRFGKSIDTTVGRYIYNKIVYHLLWDNKYFPYINEVVTKDSIEDIFKLISQLEIEKKCDRSILRRTIDMNTEFGLRLSTMYNAGLTDTMLLPDDEFMNYRDKKINAIQKQVEETGDIELLSKTENEVISYAKEHFKDDDMYEMYMSGAKANWNNDFKNLQVNLGALPKITGGKPTIIFNSLTQGVDAKYIPDYANTGFKSATDRGLQTALAGAAYKDITNAMQTVFGVKGDCGSKHGVKGVYKDKFKLLNKYVIQNGKSVKVTLDNVDRFLNKEIEVRDVIHCKEKGGNYCSHCIGESPFYYAGVDKIPLGLLTADASTAILNMFMKSTHDLSAAAFRITDMNKYIYPKLKKPLFEIKKDPIDNVEKVFCLEDVEWRLPVSAVTPEDTSYSILAHGSILTIKNNGQTEEHTIVLGTEVYSKPSEFIKPSDQDKELDRHVIFKFYKGDVFLQSTITQRKEMTVYRMFNLFLSGNVSNLVPFETHLETMRNTIASNKKVKINDLSLGIILSSLARDVNDIEKPARETESEKYKFVAMYDLIALGGTFNSLFGPDVAKSLLINISKPEKEQTKSVSPIEKALRY